MKKRICFWIVLVALLFTACGKKDEVQDQDLTNVEKTENSSGADSSTSDEEMIPATEVSNEEVSDENAENEAASEQEEAVNLSTEDLCALYVNYLNDIASQSDLVDDLVFTTVDVNNDGIRELLYAESSVNAAGVNVCFWQDGNVVNAGMFGCYGGIKYAPFEGVIISVMDNMDYMDYSVISIADPYEPQKLDRFSIEPDSDEDNKYYYFYSDEEVTHEEYAKEFAKLQQMDVRSVDYADMYMYVWCNEEYDPLDERMLKLLTEDEAGREYHMIIPADEKAKLIGTWTLYSVEIDGDVYYPEEGEYNKVIIGDDYSVYFDYGSWGFDGGNMYFVNGSFNDGAQNRDWHVSLDGGVNPEEEIYMNVFGDDQLLVNEIYLGDFGNPVSKWHIYTREK